MKRRWLAWPTNQVRDRPVRKCKNRGGALLLTDFFRPSACEKEVGSTLWIYVFVGNMLRGIGETPIMPLGISYLDDFSREENTPFYLGLFWFFFYLFSCFFF